MQMRFVAMETKIMWKNCQFWQKCVCWRWFNILGWFLRESKFFTFHVNLNAYWQPLLNIIFLCKKMVKIRVDLMIKLQQFPLLPYRWYKNPLRRNGNNYLTWNLQLRRNGNKPLNVRAFHASLTRDNRNFRRDVTVLARTRLVGKSWLACTVLCDQLTMLSGALHSYMFLICVCFCPSDMVVSCCVIDCSNRYSKDTPQSFYRIPKSHDRRSQWVAAIRRKQLSDGTPWVPTDHDRVCALHFVSGK